MNDEQQEREAIKQRWGYDPAEYWCGDNSCAFGRSGGMATNGGCRCFRGERERVERRGVAVLRSALIAAHRRVVELEEQVKRLTERLDELLPPVSGEEWAALTEVDERLQDREERHRDTMERLGLR